MIHFVCVCTTHQNVVLLIKVRDCNLSSKDLIKKIVSNPESNKCMMHGCESCLCTATLKENLDQKLSELENEGHYRSKNISFTYEEYKETLIVVIDDLTRHSCVAKPKITSSSCRRKSKATTGVKMIQATLLDTTWDQMLASKMIHCVLFVMTAAITQAFCMKFKQCLFTVLKLISYI